MDKELAICSPKYEKRINMIKFSELLMDEIRLKYYWNATFISLADFLF